MIKQKTKDRTSKENAAMEQFCDATVELLTKPYEDLMIEFLLGGQRYLSLTLNNFIPLGRAGDSNSVR